eukprot:4918270-Pyramimonas_sp.AAC.1
MLSVIPPPLHTKGDPVVVAHLADSFRWAQTALERIDANPVEVVSLLTSRRISTSSSFYGIGAPEVADQIIMNVVRVFVQQHHDPNLGAVPTPLELVNEWGIEKNRKCNMEVLHARSRDSSAGPKH